MYFLVNASSPKLLDVAISILQVQRSSDLEGTGHFVYLFVNASPS